MKSSVFKERRKNLADLILNNELYVPMKTKEIAILLGIPKELRHELQEVLDSLVADGTIGVSKKGKYMKPDNVALVGTFESTSRGFGFVVVDGQDDDIFVKASDTKDAFYHDKVKVVITAQKNGDRRREGKIIEILDHEVKTLVGTYQKNKNFGFVVPDNQKIGCDIFVSKEHEMGAVTGSKVVVKISSYGSARKNPEGKIIEVIGHMDDPGTDILSIVKAYDLPEEFPDSVKKELKGIPDEVDGNDIAGRTDLRDVVMVTIDGEDSKDLDDAVSLTKENDIYHLGVHIADVSHYVKEDSPLDKEALKRGTSVYLVDRVIPMIPHQLSNGICSLNEGCDRLALSCLMDIDMKGNIIGHKICESVINVNRRMTYTSVKKILEDNDKEECAKYSELVDMFKLMQECADILRKKRFKRGSIDFDFPESKIILDKDGRPVDIKPYDRNVATKLIEDFMLAANETVAEDYFWQEVPFLYRTHENPDPEKILKLSTFINNFGFSMHIGANEVRPKEIQKLLGKVEGTPQEALISRLALRSMKQARYTPENSGHFGLAANYYTHFTSPIRRYPDLMVHRLIRTYLFKKKLDQETLFHFASIMQNVADQASSLERKAIDIEREVDDMKMAEYMEDHIGETFEGIVSSITNFGMFVELPNTIEGLIRMEDLVDDFYYFDDVNLQLIGKRTGRRFKMSDKVKIKVSAASKREKTIDFQIVGMKSNKKKKKTVIINKRRDKKPKQKFKRKRR